MKKYKPYLSLGKTAQYFELDVVLSAARDQTITNIRQEEINKGGNVYWGVIITLSSETQLANGPETPIFSTTVQIDLDKPAVYKTVKCIVRQKFPEGQCAPPADEESDIDFDDGNP